MCPTLNRIYTLTLCWVALLSPISNGLANVLVLCQGDDGHMEIEYSGGGDCTSCFIVDDHDKSEMAEAEEDHCGSCEDTALGTEAKTNKDPKEDYLPIRVQLDIASHFLVSPSKWRRFQLPLPLSVDQPANDPIRGALSTVSLLI